MGAVTTDRVFGGGGRLFVGPTTNTWPAYGTTAELGTVHAVGLRPRSIGDWVTAEELGGEPYELIHLHEECDLLVVFDGFDSNAFEQALYLSVTSGVASVGGLTPGTKGTTTALELLYVPSEHTVAPALYLPQAVPRHDRLDPTWSGFRALQHSMRFRATRTATKNPADVGLVASMDFTA